MLPACSVIGILGGGQLGRMTALAAANLGYKTHIYTPEENSPASQVAYKTTVAAYNNAKALKAFAQSVDVVTFEFENVPAETIRILSEVKQTHPSLEPLYIAQNRLREKKMATELGIKTAPFLPVSSLGELENAFREIGYGGAILKTAELGYDGKGQVRIRGLEECEDAWKEMQNQPSILEGFVDFACEISVIIARNEEGQVATYDINENTHKDGILRVTRVPSSVTPDVENTATQNAIRIAEHLGLVGILAIEFFVTREGEVLFNEMAPRPHNSGHWTMDAARTSQFEQFVRAVAGLPLGSTERTTDVTMHNLIGDDVLVWQQYLERPNVKLHLYGKTKITEGRKMGHVNYLGTE